MIYLLAKNLKDATITNAKLKDFLDAVRLYLII
jgi:hypothetical protein